MRCELIKNITDVIIKPCHLLIVVIIKNTANNNNKLKIQSFFESSSDDTIETVDGRMFWILPRKTSTWQRRNTERPITVNAADPRDTL